MKRIKVWDTPVADRIVDLEDPIDQYAPYILRPFLLAAVLVVALVVVAVEAGLRWALIPARWRA